ncbi:MAG: hypothetical protein HY015_00635, partial [Bacteroidetes bacterium]|nr:hypothetical protein [Bacteroidota bacterium]MBI3481484.1 hypothetical protein [Bacteroidota bacterium]
MQLSLNHILFIVAAFAFTRCANDSDPAADKSNFTRIFDNNQFNASYYPVDMVQTPDGGYLILGGRSLTSSSFSGTYIMKADPFGNFVSAQEVDENLVDPVGNILVANGKYYFFCMTAVGLQTQMIELDAMGAITNQIDIGASYPAAASQEGNNFLLLSYDNTNKLSVVSKLSPDGNIIQSRGYTIGAGSDVEAPIIAHFVRSGRQFPFQVGKNPDGQYFFNGFYNYTFSLVFTDLAAGNPLGVVQGQQNNGGMSAILPLDRGTYSVATFNFGDNYLLPSATINGSNVSSATDLPGNSFPELVTNAKVKIVLMTLGTKNYILYGSTTKSKQIALYAYDKTSFKFSGSKYLGFSNPFEIASMTSTADGGLAICGTTYVAGRFPRICLFKISSTTLQGSFN